MNTMTDTSVIATFDKAALFAALKPKSKEVEIEGFGKLRIVGITARMAEETQQKAKDAAVKFWVYLLIRCAVDGNNQPVFDEGDVDTLQDSGNAQIDALVNEALIVNGYKKAADEKNLQTTPTADSSSV